MFDCDEFSSGHKTHFCDTLTVLFEDFQHQYLSEEWSHTLYPTTSQQASFHIQTHEISIDVPVQAQVKVDAQNLQLMED